MRAAAVVAALALLLGPGCAPGGCAPSAPAGGAAARKPPAAAIAGRVVRVRDGDSLVVLAGGRRVEVRLDGVDAPELAQAFGRGARRCASDLAAGRQVWLAVRGRDKYDRTLAEVYLPDGRSLNEELVAAGCAWWFRRHSDDPDLAAGEADARAARRGLWADPDPVPPWEFRDSRRAGPGRGR